MYNLQYTISKIYISCVSDITILLPSGIVCEPSPF